MFLLSGQRSPRRVHILWALIAALLWGRPAAAQPAEPQEPAGETAAAPAAAPAVGEAVPPSPKERARQTFMRGVQLFEDGELDAALAEFRLSQATFATRVAGRNTAVCLRALGRFDEALDALDELGRRFPDMSAEWKAMLSRDRREIEKRVGVITIAVATAGATVLVSGRVRGVTPLANELRVTSGSHSVRISRNGFVPYETRVEVAGGEAAVVSATLEPLSQSGELRVIERDGRSADVVVDQETVGTTPWSGRLSLGTHTVFLRGDDDLGTQPAAVVVKEAAPAMLSLALETLSATLRIEPLPAGARVALDGVELGNGVWEGRVRPGQHRVEVAAEDFLTVTREAVAEAGAIDKIVVELKRDPTSERWAIKHPPKIVFDVDLGFAIAGALGGELSEACDGCAAPAIGGRAMLRIGYEFGIGLGLFLDVGYLGMYKSLSERDGRLFSVSSSGESDPGVIDDELVLQGLLVGAAAAYHRGDPLGFHARLGVGAIVGTLSDRRSGTFMSPTGDYDVGPYVEDADAHYVYAAPEGHLSYRVADNLQLSAGLSVLFAFNVTQPTWQDRFGVPSASPFFGEFNGPGAPRESAGHLVVFIPSIGARVDF